MLKSGFLSISIHNLVRDGSGFSHTWKKSLTIISVRPPPLLHSESTKSIFFYKHFRTIFSKRHESKIVRISYIRYICFCHIWPTTRGFKCTGQTSKIVLESNNVINEINWWISKEKVRAPYPPPPPLNLLVSIYAFVQYSPISDIIVIVIANLFIFCKFIIIKQICVWFCLHACGFRNQSLINP